MEPSTSVDCSNEIPKETEEALASDIIKKETTQAFFYCQDLLLQDDRIMENVKTKYTPREMVMGERMFKSVVETIDDGEFITDEYLFLNESDMEADLKLNEGVEEILSQPETSQSSQTTSNEASSQEIYEVLPPKKAKINIVPLTLKIKAVTLWESNPNWSIKTIASKSTQELKHKSQLYRWKQQILQGGTIKEKYEQINTWVYDRFKECRLNRENVTTRTLRQWAMAAASQFSGNDDFSFKASQTWADTFKKTYHIRQRRITKFISKKDICSVEDIKKSAELFQRQTNPLINTFNPDFVINTDQTGCEYRIHSNRTLSFRGEKTTEAVVGDMNKLMHSYTAQYSLTSSGKLLPKVFLCLQERTGQFGPRVLKQIKDFMTKFPNVHITCTKSGKLQKNIYGDYLDSIVKPYVEKNKFLLIVDSWGGQTDLAMHNEKFIDHNDMPTCTLKIIPPRCTSICQPCDVYFYRQVKNYISRLQNADALIADKREITSREDSIKIHAIIHNQLSAPIYKNMIQYAWYASKLINERNIFLNVNQIAFPIDVIHKLCDCGNLSFVCCSWCRKYVCFECFFNNYHPDKCDVFNEDNEN